MTPTTQRKPRSEAKRYTINVTDDDIARAQHNNSYKCVVAQAIARYIPDATRVEVDTQCIRFTRPSIGRLTYLTPYLVQGYVIAFDAGEEIHPIKFQLQHPVRIKQRLATEEGKKAVRARGAAIAATKKASTKASTKSNAKKRPTKTTGPSQATTAAEPTLSPKEAYAQARRENPGQARVTTSGDRSQAPRRMFRARKREYGNRLLRINRQLEADATTD